MWVSGGRWGPRRARVGQCTAVLAAELAYDRLLREGAALAPGWRAVIAWTPDGASQAFEFQAEVLPNAIWRRGRVELKQQIERGLGRPWGITLLVNPFRTAAGEISADGVYRAADFLCASRRDERA